MISLIGVTAFHPFAAKMTTTCDILINVFSIDVKQLLDLYSSMVPPPKNMLLILTAALAVRL